MKLLYVTKLCHYIYIYIYIYMMQCIALYRFEQKHICYASYTVDLIRGSTLTETSPPPLVRLSSNHLHELFYWTNKQPPTGRVQERSKGDTACLSNYQNPSRAFFLAEWCVHHQERLWIRMIVQRQPRN